MLIDCPECEQKVSDKALSCPHCGYPFSKSVKYNKPPRHMRLPNGFGRITKLNGKNLRKPYRVMVSVGKDENGRPIGKLLKPTAYFASYNEAYAALLEYNKSPYDLSTSITMNELFTKWFAKHEATIVHKRATDIRRVWGYCSSIHDMDITRIRTRTIRELFDSIDRSDSVKKMIKHTLSQMFDYAVEYEYVSRNIVKDISWKADTSVEDDFHKPFTDEEFARILEHKQEAPYDLICIQCYTGMRPSELLAVEVNNLNMSEWYLIGGSKTRAGRDRKIPIHKAIRDLIRSKYNEAIKKGTRYLFGSRKNAKMTYNTYHEAFVSAFPDHKPHDPRKHFVTMAKKAGVDEYAIKLIVGHAISDITESVYTERDVKWLHRELAKIQIVY